ncbi:TonB-dependent receptor plug domain-containing protein [Pseudopedobacter saltans]|nr:TonB-dependent receptor [Pseudopedobacter saltans]
MIRSLKRVLSVQFILVTIWALPSYALSEKKIGGEGIADTTKVYFLEEVQVKALKQSRILVSPVPMQILSASDLQRINTFSIADAVRYLSGVQLKDYGGVGGLRTINVRSLGANHTAVFYDGLQLTNAQNGQVDLGKFSTDNIEEISLYNGQNPQLLQPAAAYATANVLYLKSKEPVFENDNKYNASIALKTGSFGLLNPATSLDYRWNNNISSRLSAEYLYADGKYKFTRSNGNSDTTAIRQNGDIEALRIEYGTYGKINAGSWRAQIFHYQSERGLPRATVANKFDATQRLWDNNTFVQTGLEKSLNKHYSFAINTKYAYDYQRYLDPEIVTSTGLLDNKYHQKEFYLSLSNSYKLTAFWNIALATDYRYNKLDANLYHFAYPVRNVFLAALSNNIYFQRFNGQISLLSTTVDENVKYYESLKNQQRYTPTFMFSWQPVKHADSFRLRGFYKSIFRMPTFNDLYYTFVGNTFLKPEFAKQYDLGITYGKSDEQSFINRIELQVDAYYNKVKDKIVAVPSLNLFRWTMLNLNRVDIRGVDLNVKLSKDLNTKSYLDMGLVYTYQQALNVTNGVSDGQIPYAPKHSGSFIASWIYDKSSLNYSYIYTGERYSQTANIPVNYIQSWYIHNISIQHKFKIEKHATLTIRGEVNNLFNQYYDVIENFPMPGRSYRLAVYYKL